MAGRKNNGFKNEIPPDRLTEDGKYILSQDEKDKILVLWNIDKVVNLKDLIQGVWGIDELDGRSRQGQALRAFLASRDIAANPAQNYIKKTDTESLSDEDKEFIRNHAAELKPFQIAKARWPDIIGIGDIRFRLTDEYYKSLPPELWSPSYVPSVNADYNPPKNITQTLARLRKYKLCDWEEEKMSVFQKNCIKKLIEFSNIHRFERDMSSIKDQKERDLVECEFFRHVYDKPDLSNEDISIYINAVFTILDIKRLRQDEAAGREMIENSVDDEGKFRFNQAMVDYVGTIRNEIGQRQNKLETTLNKLNGQRSERLANTGNENSSLASFVDLLKDKTKRDKILRLMKKEQEKLREEMAELNSMEALKFEMWGANPNELY